MLDTMRRLYPRGPANRGICVDAGGAMLGPDCILVRRTRSGFRPIERGDAAGLQKCVLSADRDDDWLFRQCERIADALNKGEVALAQIHGLYIPVGELDERQLRSLATIRFAKSGFSLDEPRLPKGDPHGGEWTGGGGDSASADTPRLEPSGLAGLTEDNVPPQRLAQLTTIESGDGFPSGGNTQPLPQWTTIESSDTSPTGAAINGTGAARAADEARLRYEMGSPGAPPAAGPAETAGGANGGTAATGGGAAASLHVPGRDAINPDYSIENLLFNVLPTGGIFFIGGTASRALGRALEKTGIARLLGVEAHHIVAWRAKRAEPAQAILDGFKVDRNSAPNGAFLQKEVHQSLHNNEYYDAVNDLLATAVTKAEALEILEAIRSALEAGEFPGMLP
jgi:hypothetical protein